MNCGDPYYWHHGIDIAQHQELSDEDISRATPDALRTAYRALRERHVTETTALASRRDDLTRRRDEQLANCHEIIEESQKLIERADTIMRNHEEVIDRLGAENVRLSRALHHWTKTTANVLARRTADPEDPWATCHLSNEELFVWANRAGLYEDEMKGTCLRAIVDELRERREAEVLFVEIDRKFQGVIDCVGCSDGGPDGCGDHKDLIRQWRAARSALCDLARIHRRYLMSLNAPGGGDLR